MGYEEIIYTVDKNVAIITFNRPEAMNALTGVTHAELGQALDEANKDKNIKVAKIHAAFMGGLQPTKFLMYAPDTIDPENWANESETTEEKHSMIVSMSGIIQYDGVGEPTVKIHFVNAGAWDVQPFGGHLSPGSICHGLASRVHQ